MEHYISNPNRPKPRRLDWIVPSGIRKLKETNVVLKQVDKNLGIVTIHAHIYHQMVMSDLMDHNVYQQVATFPVYSIEQRIQHILYLSKLSTRRRSEMLEPESSSDLAPFYVIPKIHKKKLFASVPIAA